ncbi:MAG: hypothetical protein M0Z94_08200 [Dehalococcoidales bacterium]|nr:hypothetical protein [Dehalococcoidales bacterium]
MEDVERRRRRLERDLTRARAKLAAMKRENYKTASAYQRVRTQLRGHIAELENLLRAIGEPCQQEGAPGAQGLSICPRCRKPRERLYYLEGGPVALCYLCWVELGKQWWDSQNNLAAFEPFPGNGREVTARLASP